MQVIAIDGPAGSGKSTVARAVAAKLGLDHLDTGAMYRAVTFAVLRRDLDPTDEAATAEVARSMDLLQDDDGTVTVDGVDATEAIRGPEVTQAVSAVAANGAVREELVRRQRAWIDEHDGGVLEGRDIGTVVAPDATLKVYLDASEAVRAARRSKESGDSDEAAVAADLARRDRLDSSRAHSPLQRSGDAITIDTSELTIDEVISMILEQLP